MKKAGRRFHRIFRAVFAAALALAITGANLAPAAAVTWADVNELKDEANGLDAEKKELQAKLDALADDKSQAVARKELLDQQIANTEAQIANTQAQIDRYAALITQTEAELVEAEEKEAAQYELFCSRVREMEKQDEVSYWAVLFRASSFTDLLGRLDAINEIMKYDQGVIDDLKALQAEIEEKKATLESSPPTRTRRRPHWQIWRRSRTPCGRRPSASATNWWPSRPPTASPQSPIQAATSGR